MNVLLAGSLVVGALIAFGALTIFSIGLYFWFLAAALALLSPRRSRQAVEVQDVRSED